MLILTQAETWLVLGAGLLISVLIALLLHDWSEPDTMDDYIKQVDKTERERFK